MSKQRSVEQRHRQYAKSIRVAAPLLDGPRTFAEILDRYYSYLRPRGLFKMTERQTREQMASVRERLEELVGLGWIVCEGERYALTSPGREEVNKGLSQLSETGALIREFLRPQAVSKVTLGVHYLFGLILSIMLLLLAAGSGLARGAQPVGYPVASGANVDPAATAPWFISIVDSALGVGQYVSVAIDDSGTTYISYYDATNTALKMAKHVGSGGNCGTDNAWECETVDNSGDVGRFSSIAIDPTTNLPAIAYCTTTYDLKLAILWGGGWDIMTVDSSHGYMSLKIDSTGAAHIAYSKYGELGYAKRVGSAGGNCGGDNYQCDTIDSCSGSCLYPSLALDGSGQPRIAYYESGEDDLWYAQPGPSGNCGPGNSWGCYQVDTTSDVGLYASLDVDDSNLSHIAYYDRTDGKLMYAVQVGTGGNCGLLGSWQCDEIAAMGTQGTHPRTRDVSLAVDKAGFPIIAYSWYYGTPFSTRGFSWARPAAALGLQSGNCGPQDLWQCEWIQDGTYSGDYSALAVHPSGLATIAYSHGEYFSALRVAYQQFQVFLPLVMKNQ